MQYLNRGRLAFWMFSRWCLEGSITADTQGSGQSISRGPDKYGFISRVMETGTGVLTLSQWSQGTRDQWSHSENDHQSGQGGRDRSTRTYSRWWEDYLSQPRYSQRDNGYNAWSRGRRQQEERRDQRMYHRLQQHRDRVWRPSSGERSHSRHQVKKPGSTSANRGQPTQIVEQSSKAPREAGQPWLVTTLAAFHSGNVQFHVSSVSGDSSADRESWPSYLRSVTSACPSWTDNGDPEGGNYTEYKSSDRCS